MLHDVDIMLCDIEMPGENGIELLRWVRQEHMDVECIFLTCHANFSYAQDAVKLDCMDYVLIPVRYEEIAESVRKVACRRAKKQEKDDLPMDVSENPFYIKDASYEMNKPDEINFDDERVKAFIKFIG